MAIDRRYLRKKYSSGSYRMQRRMRSVENILIYIGVAVVFLAAILFIRGQIFSVEKKISVSLSDVSAFRIPYGTFKELNELSAKYKLDFNELLTVYSLENGFFPAEAVGSTVNSDIEKNFIMDYESLKKEYNKSEIKKYSEIFRNIFAELEYFPIPTGFEGASEDIYMYGDSWGSERNYGGERAHEGADIFDRENIRGRIPIVSMTDGVIENIGWNELGGYRIGIRTERETYYYYAHMDSYAPGLANEMAIQAGQLLGYMGDSGYSKKEGSTGNFQVHLHVGISPKTELAKKEFWINPYIFLRAVESLRAEYVS